MQFSNAWLPAIGFFLKMHRAKLHSSIWVWCECTWVKRREWEHKFSNLHTIILVCIISFVLDSLTVQALCLYVCCIFWFTWYFKRWFSIFFSRVLIMENNTTLLKWKRNAKNKLKSIFPVARAQRTQLHHKSAATFIFVQHYLPLLPTRCAAPRIFKFIVELMVFLFLSIFNLADGVSFSRNNNNNNRYMQCIHENSTQSECVCVLQLQIISFSVCVLMVFAAYKSFRQQAINNLIFNAYFHYIHSMELAHSWIVWAMPHAK